MPTITPTRSRRRHPSSALAGFLPNGRIWYCPNEHHVTTPWGTTEVARRYETQYPSSVSYHFQWDWTTALEDLANCMMADRMEGNPPYYANHELGRPVLFWNGAARAVSPSPLTWTAY